MARERRPGCASAVRVRGARRSLWLQKYARGLCSECYSRAVASEFVVVVRHPSTSHEVLARGAAGDGIGALVPGPAESTGYTCVRCRSDAYHFALAGGGPCGRRVPPPFWVSLLLGTREAARSRRSPSDNGGGCQAVLHWNWFGRRGKNVCREDRISRGDPIRR